MTNIFIIVMRKNMHSTPVSKNTFPSEAICKIEKNKSLLSCGDPKTNLFNRSSLVSGFHRS